MKDRPQRILGVFAHPDDECYCVGGTMARYVQDGAVCKVISATRGQAGEIHAAEVVNRETLGQVREQELEASCKALGVQHMECWDYLDGHLSEADEDQLVGDVANAIRTFDPQIVVTFGDDGAYGHPDHIAISRATTQAFHQVGTAEKLYYAHFPQRNLLLLDEISSWLVSIPERFSGTTEFAHALSLFVRESVMLNFSRDAVDVRWYPPNFYILEQGEPSKELFVLMSGEVRVQQRDPDGTVEEVATMTVGDFFGEQGVASGKPRSADIITSKSTTCLVFSPEERTNYTGRGEDAVTGADSQVADTPAEKINIGNATHVLDVRPFVKQKINAISSHRTQTPINPDIFPEETLKRLLGMEFFIQAHPPQALGKVL